LQLPVQPVYHFPCTLSEAEVGELLIPQVDKDRKPTGRFKVQVGGKACLKVWDAFVQKLGKLQAEAAAAAAAGGTGGGDAAETAAISVPAGQGDTQVMLAAAAAAAAAAAGGTVGQAAGTVAAAVPSEAADGGSEAAKTVQRGEQ
jgi:hypothetical protein